MSITATFEAAPPRTGRGARYVCNRAPLVPNPLIKLPIGSITPAGWLRYQLEAMRDGQIGHLAEFSKWLNPRTSAWRSPQGAGEFGWEELPYWLRGFTELAYVLADERLIAEARGWIDGMLAGQEADGYFGPRENKTKLDLWPNMVALNVLQAHHEATGDERVLECLTRYFHWQARLPVEDLFPGSWQKIRAGDNLESVLWLYNRTGENWLLDLGHLIHQRTIRWDLKVADWHGVNICQGYRAPAVYYMLAGRRSLLDAAERTYRTVRELYGQVSGGMFGADENCRPGYHDPRQAAETCSMVELMHSLELLLAITGDVVQADRCEEVAFNDLPATHTPDLKALRYLTAPNLVMADRGNKSPGVQNSDNTLAFDPHDHRCCQHNAGMGWPQFAEHPWMATGDSGLAAVLYAPCRVQARVGDGTEVTIEESTDYPFDETVTCKLGVPRPTAFPLYLRVPGWCAAPQVAVNGRPVAVTGRPTGYIRLDGTWNNGDAVQLTLPMNVQTVSWRTNQDAVSVRRGPLWYSLRIGERWQRFGDNAQWPGWEVFPTTPWNYGLVLNPDDPAAAFQVARKAAPLPAQPFVPDGARFELTAKARRVPAWKLDAQNLVEPLQASPVRSSEPEETVTLIPMGCARLRISAFPVIGDGPQAHDWVATPAPRHETSYCWDPLTALSDGEVASCSHDHLTPRMSWLGHRGTKEWITYNFGRPRRVSWSEVYWVDDRGRSSCAVPAGWSLFFRVGEEWRPVRHPSSYGTELDRFNRVDFDPIETTVLRLEVQLQPEKSGGVFEWNVGGPR